MTHEPERRHGEGEGIDRWDRVEASRASRDARHNGTHPRRVEPDHAALSDLARQTLIALGEDVAREGLTDTPERVARSLAFLTIGYRQTLDDVVGGALFAEDYDELVLVRDIEFYSLCEHHMLPFFGRAHVGYFPDGRVLGLSKLPRIVEMYARRLQVQERLTREIADAVATVARPRGVGVVIEAEHLCMSMRGVQKPGSRTVTSRLLGALADDSACRAEFLSLVRP